MRADARKNHSHLLAVARDVVTEHGADASMRDIARRAGVGLATLFRHFPTREALFEALLGANLDALTRKADELETLTPPDEALVSWFREGVAFVHSYRGVVDLMASAHTDPDSALYASCAAVHAAGARLLLRAQAEGTARADLNGDDLFALMSALGWLVSQPSFAPRADHLFHVIASAVLTNRSSDDIGKATPCATSDVKQHRSRPVKSPARDPGSAATIEYERGRSDLPLRRFARWHS
jgi:AcrR family transcriptional regulator